MFPGWRERPPYGPGQHQSCHIELAESKGGTRSLKGNEEPWNAAGQEQQASLQALVAAAEGRLQTHSPHRPRYQEGREHPKTGQFCFHLRHPDPNATSCKPHRRVGAGLARNQKASRLLQLSLPLQPWASHFHLCVPISKRQE